MTFDLDM